MESTVAPVKLLNNRYQKVKRLGEGSYGTVYLAIDMKPDGLKRKADPKALELLKEVKEEEDRRDEDVKMTDVEDTRQKEALKVLSDRAQVFQQNEAFADVEVTSSQDKQVYVAIKKVKMNDFNVSPWGLSEVVSSVFE